MSSTIAVADQRKAGHRHCDGLGLFVAQGFARHMSPLTMTVYILWTKEL